jgi:hypothetical protein
MKSENHEIVEDLLCPCESGHLYGECCKGKVLWVENSKGEISQVLNIPPFLAEEFKRLKEFHDKNPGSSDKLFPGITNKYFTEMTLSAYFKTGMSAAWIYANMHTDGLMIFDNNKDKAKKSDRDQFEGLLAEFCDLSTQDQAVVLAFAVKKFCPKIASKFNKKFCQSYVIEHPLTKQSDLDDPTDLVDDSDAFEEEEEDD